jgi:hypothetical protein
MRKGTFKYIKFLVTIPFVLHLFLAGNALGLPSKAAMILTYPQATGSPTR